MSTPTAITTGSPYQEMTKGDLVEGIKKQSRRARSKGLEMIEAMKTTGHMLIELKARTKHGTFMSEAQFLTGINERTIQRYMEMARGVAPIRTVTPRERKIGRTDPLPLIRATEFLPDDTQPKTDTVSVLPASPPAPRPSSASQVIEAHIEVMEPQEPEIVEPQEPEVIETPATPAPASDPFQEIIFLLPELSHEQFLKLIEIINSRWLRQ
jgi:hypothetical protein